MRKAKYRKERKEKKRKFNNYEALHVCLCLHSSFDIR